jgi:membrane protease YdiL (CAAX protease family)
MIASAVPFSEELLFRGILLHRWQYKWGRFRAILFTSLLFAPLHPEPAIMFLFAVLAAQLTLRTGSLLPAHSPLSTYCPVRATRCLVRE